MADRSTSNWTNLLNNSMELEDTVTLGSKVGVMAKPVSREDTKSSNDPTAGLTDILIKILGSFSGDVKDLEETKVNSRDVADEVYSKYDILEPIEDPAKARRIGGLTTKNLPMPVNAPVGRQRFSIFPEAEEVEDVVDDGLMSRQVTPEERAALSKLKADDTGDGLMSSPRPKARPKDIEETLKAPTKEELVSSVFKAEGGYSTDKKDTGNYHQGKFVGTNHGISANTLATHLGRTPTVDDMKKLTKDDARKIAEKKYYDRFAIDELPSELQEIVFHSVFMGETRGVRAMQNLLGLEPDGKLGPITKKAMATASFSKKDFRDEYLRELQFGTPLIQPKTNLPYSEPSGNWNAMKKGWTNRYNKLAK